jgi:DNA repair protein RadB
MPLNNLKGLTIIYGASGSGKSSFCLEIAKKELNENNKVLFLDTENNFSIERLQQILNNKEKLKSIFVLKIKNIREQQEKIKNLTALIKKINPSLIIIDTISPHYKRLFKHKPDLAKAMLFSQLKILKQISYSIPILITNQVYEDFSNKKIKMVAKNTLTKFSNRIIKLEKSPRKMITEKPIKKINSFEITQQGIIFYS